MNDSYSIAKPTGLFQEPGAAIRMVSMDGTVLGYIANSQIATPQELADEVSRLIAEHNGLVHLSDRLNTLLSAANKVLEGFDTMMDNDRLVDFVVEQVRQELGDAQRRFPRFNSPHEGWAVIAEELDELWEIVRGKTGQRVPEQMTREAIQVAAMAIRFAVEISIPKSNQSVSI